jgi:hypothetical protein
VRVLTTQAIGVYSALNLAMESSLGVLPTDLTGKVFSMPFNSVSLAGTQKTTDPATMTGRRDAVEAIYGNIDVTGSVVVPVDSRAFGYWLAFALGSPTTTAGEGGVYTHVFKAGNTQPSAVVEKAFSNGIYIADHGCKVSKIAFSFGKDGELTANFDILGCKETTDTKSIGTSTAVKLDRYNNFQAAVKVDNTASGIITALTCDIDFGLDGEGYAIGSNGYRTRINEGILKPNGKVTAFFDDSTFITKAVNSTQTSIEVTMTKGTTSLDILMPELKFAQTTPGISGQGGVSQELNYNAYYGTNANDTCILFTLTNDVASYAI